MGCGSSREASHGSSKSLDRNARNRRKPFRIKTHKGIKFLKEIDARLADNLKDGSIRLVRADFLRSDILSHIERRQSLEGRESTSGESIFLSPREAVDLLAKSSRAIGVLTYGWTTSNDPDVTGTYLAAVRRFLLSDLGACIVAVFWDYLSLHQKPRTPAEDEQFSDALDCMGDLYASALGTMVMRHHAIPSRPANLDGVVTVIVEAPHTCMHPSHVHELRVSKAVARGCDLCGGSASPMYSCLPCDVDICFDCCKQPLVSSIGASEPLLRVAFDNSDVVLQSITFQGDREWRLQFASHAEAQVALARDLSAAGLPNAVCFPTFNARPYSHRGWTNFESGVSGEVLCRLSPYPRLREHLEHLPPKMVEIDGPSPVPVGIDTSEGVGAHSASVRAALASATFTGKGDKQRVTTLYHDYVNDMCDALVDSGEEPLSSYAGERDARGRKHGQGVETSLDGYSYSGEWRHDKSHGTGIMRLPSGDTHEGEFHRDKAHGQGTFTTVDGKVYLGAWKDDKRHGAGVEDWPKGATEFDFYDGEWLADENHGHGVLRYSDGRVYEGQFQHDEHEGSGTMWYPDGDVYVGKWKEGSYHGGGALYISPEADRRRPWKGEYWGVETARFKRGVPQGTGMRWCPDGTIQKLHFDAAKEEKRLLLRGMDHGDAVKMAAKLGITPPDALAAPVLSETVKARIASAEVRRMQQRPATGLSISLGLEVPPLDDMSA